MRTAARDVDSYLASVPEDARRSLEDLRKTIKSVAPKAVEVISYQIPAYKYHGLLVGFAAFKNHCSFFVMGTRTMDAFQDELKSYETAKATIHFLPGKPLPVALVKKLIKARIKENEERMLK
jgi:uncharacterized protein YdhG (YjbR/CyaY superfamily)